MIGWARRSRDDSEWWDSLDPAQREAIVRGQLEESRKVRKCIAWLAVLGFPVFLWWVNRV